MTANTAINSHQLLSSATNNDMSSVHIVDWPVKNVLAFTTKRMPPLPENKKLTSSSKNTNTYTNSNTNTYTNSNGETHQGYSTFNLGLHVGDNSADVEKNRECLLTFLQELKKNSSLLPVNETTASHQNTTIQWFDQVHGADVVEVKGYQCRPITADAAITRDKNIALAIMTADCLPILLASEDGSEVAAIHGGWRPLSKNIITNTVHKMQTKPESIFAWLGPCIGFDTFEVGEEVREQFILQDDVFATAFKVVESSEEKEVHSSRKYLADLHTIARIQLNQLGITCISALAHCTYQRTQEYYSYRRESITGRMASVICL